MEQNCCYLPASSYLPSAPGQQNHPRTSTTAVLNTAYLEEHGVLVAVSHFPHLACRQYSSSEGCLATLTLVNQGVFKVSSRGMAALGSSALVEYWQGFLGNARSKSTYCVSCVCVCTTLRHILSLNG